MNHNLPRLLAVIALAVAILTATCSPPWPLITIYWLLVACKCAREARP